MNKRGQVWIETVLYTLIGLALMGLALGFVMPKINESRDRALVEQAINSLAALDGKVNDAIQAGTGNVRQATLLMKKGELYINSTSDEMIMVLTELTKPYSEPGVLINIGRVEVMSESGPKTSTVYLKVGYNANLTYLGEDRNKKFSAASTDYKFFIENKGSPNGPIWIDIEEVSNR